MTNDRVCVRCKALEYDEPLTRYRLYGYLCGACAGIIFGDASLPQVALTPPPVTAPQEPTEEPEELPEDALEEIEPLADDEQKPPLLTEEELDLLQHFKELEDAIDDLEDKNE